MRVLLISANTETLNMPTLPLGLACVAASVKKAGHEAALVNLMFEKDAAGALRESVEAFRPDVIGVSVRNIDNQDMEHPRFLLPPVRDVVRGCRALSRAPVVVGGAGFSIFPESALRYLGADMGIPGEGEAVFPALLERMVRGARISDVPGVCRPGCPAGNRIFQRNLDDMPLPEPGLFLPAGEGGLWVPVQSRRGCPLDCTYCSTGTIEGRPIRRRSPERVVRWLTDLEAAGCRNITFVDNTFNLPPRYAKELCRKIIEAGLDLNLWCLVYPKWIDTELVDLMRKAGCGQVSFGFESGSNRILGSLNKRFTKEEAAAASEMFRDAGVERRGFLLLGGPGETRDTVEESLSFTDSLELDAVKITAGIRIYPGTPLARTALAEGVTKPGDDLLAPRFYMAAGLREWLPERIAAYGASRPWVT